VRERRSQTSNGCGSTKLRRHPEALAAQRRASKDGHQHRARGDPSRRRASARLLRMTAVRVSNALLERDVFRSKRSLLTSPRRGEVEAGASAKASGEGTLHAFEHPERGGGPPPPPPRPRPPTPVRPPRLGVRALSTHSNIRKAPSPAAHLTMRGDLSPQGRGESGLRFGLKPSRYSILLYPPAQTSST
jgi:hypothetical protein